MFTLSGVAHSSGSFSLQRGRIKILTSRQENVAWHQSFMIIEMARWLENLSRLSRFITAILVAISLKPQIKTNFFTENGNTVQRYTT